MIKHERQKFIDFGQIILWAFHNVINLRNLLHFEV